MEQAKGSPLFCGRVLHSSSLILTGMLMTPPEPRKRKIGFIVKERAAKYGRSEIKGIQGRAFLSRQSVLTENENLARTPRNIMRHKLIQ